MLVVLSTKDRLTCLFLRFVPMVHTHGPVWDVLSKKHWRRERVTLIEAEAHLMYLYGLFLHFVWQLIVVWVVFAKSIKLLWLVRLQIEHVAELSL